LSLQAVDEVLQILAQVLSWVLSYWPVLVSTGFVGYFRNEVETTLHIVFIRAVIYWLSPEAKDRKVILVRVLVNEAILEYSHKAFKTVWEDTQEILKRFLLRETFLDESWVDRVLE
jgi:hypothetical protein